MNTLFITPSAKIRLKRFGNLKANKNASERILAPKKFANKTSLKKPVTRELNIFEDIFEKLFIFIEFRKIHFPKFL